MKHQTVAVIGAGVAGLHTACRLAQAGFSVTVLDAAAGPCSGASGNPAGAFHAHLSRDDMPLSRLSRWGVQSTIHSLEMLTNEGLLVRGSDWDCSGHLQLFDSEQDELRMRDALARHPTLAAQIHVLSVSDIEARTGLRPKLGGLLFDNAGWVKPERWCAALLEQTKHRVEVNRLFPVQFQWNTCVQTVDVSCPSEPKVLSDGPVGKKTQRFDKVVVASATESLLVRPVAHAKSNAVKGQISYVRTDRLLPHVLSGAAYVIQKGDSEWLIGATFERDQPDTRVTDEGHQLNLTRLKNAFDDYSPGEVTGGRSSLRAIWPDRMPAIGPVIDEQGNLLPSVMMATGFGSRGLSWCALAAELICCRWLGLSSPLPQALEAAVLPGRFFSRASNSKPTLPSLPITR